ncbi:ABC transporter substrate-binding protein [Actinomadura violacea]|uniref:Protein kinase n=1 Tax=Actinomadura violacea TaxID=2819934 RepID=A0ABS3RRQ2_9ACTN|nr:ABC transporter substrate-binding protein [Actinomadura violacea]MBO2459440.1 protein kinase [Actinomadura violacea]
MADIRPLRPGDPERLGGYRLTGLLGEGGQGAVYLAEDEPGHRVAVKLLHARFSADPKARSRFAAEVAVAQRVEPFCTARILDSDVEGDRPYIVSEYIDGPSLSAALAEGGPQRGADLDRLAIGTMTALAAIHQAGIVHRDFKPANVLLAADGPRVIDFGIARALDATGTLSSTAVGTPAYMAPEQISGAPVGPAADVFAWGATMAVAATGRPAFGQGSIPAVMHRILNMAPDLGMTPEPLRGVVADCLSKDPALRPASQQVLATLLTLAGSPPKPGGGAGEGAGEMLSKGAETAAAESARLHAARSPLGVRQPLTPQSLGSHPQLAQSPPAPFHQPPAPPAQVPPQPQGVPVPGAQVPGGPWAGPAAYGGPSTWPSGRQAPPAPGIDMTKPPGTRPRRRIGVLAGAGGAAAAALAIVATVVVVNLDGGGGPHPKPPVGKVGGNLTVSLADVGTDQGAIDPSHAFGGTERFLGKQLFAGLTETGPDGTTVNRLATAVTPDPACSNWKIAIRSGTTFSDGEPVDAAAFARGWARSAATATGAGPVLMTDIEGYSDVESGKASEFSGVQATGDSLAVRLTSPNCDFPARLADPVFAPVPRAAGPSANQAYNMNPVGNGPFKLQSYTKGKSVMLVRNDRYAFGRTKLDGVEVDLSPDTTRGRAAFTAGQTGWATLRGSDLTTARGMSGLVTKTLPFTRMLVPITARGPMKSKEARLAVSYALNRTQLAQVWGPAHKPAHGIVPSSIPGFGGPGTCASCDAPDPARAKTFAAQGGLKPGSTVQLYVQQVGSNQAAAQAVVAQLKSNLGINVKVVPIPDITKFRSTVVADDSSGLALFAWGADYPAPYTMLWPLLGGTIVGTPKNDYYNLSGWKNSTFDNLISTAVRTSQPAARTDLYKRAEKTALDDMALIPLVYDGGGALVSSRYVGLKPDYDGDPTVATAALR